MLINHWREIFDPAAQIFFNSTVRYKRRSHEDLKNINLAIIISLMPTIGYSCEISLYNHTGEAVAYIDTNDEMNIYLWNSEPVAYLDGESIYGFNGKHLGWFKEGIICDHKGYAVGFIEGTVNKITKLERLKGPKRVPPTEITPRVRATRAFA